jgi:hypothetical protein
MDSKTEEEEEGVPTYLMLAESHPSTTRAGKIYTLGERPTNFTRARLLTN